MKHKKWLAYSLMPALALFILGADTAAAQGFGFGLGGKNVDPTEAADRLQEMFASQAKVLGLEVSDIKEAWAEGKTIKELADEKGIDLNTLRDKMKAQRLVDMKAHLQALVDKGVITQTQANKRLEFMQKATDKIKDKAEKTGGRGWKMMGGPMMGWF
ncbi:MAG: hypothetical protein A2571_00955 [Candidatus Vogelbacteria bacterium RIFOXYD1_FULL_44_32]|uniref:DUF2680 domain-containing protein n=1 Tax=Candidatus Vogelbacteria bacterium RIFOXYD1_FULL_44_32 TaxID=1802438 RepID=A0A1G2QEB2_9BACT|nr:MAG: hypothetical protein A2571_00955 [Candidatus Vogelbacteria bacterium RIFOXYD1_FULL_44_32]